MKQLLSAIARIFGGNTIPEFHDTGMDTPIYDQIKWEFQQRNPHFTLTKGV